MLAIILLASLPPSPSTAAVEAIDLGKLTRFEAEQLDGRTVRVWFIAERLEDDCSGWASVVQASGLPGLARWVHFSHRMKSKAVSKNYSAGSHIAAVHWCERG